LEGEGGQIPKKNSLTEKIQKKNIVHNKPIEKKIEQELGLIFKIVMRNCFTTLKWCFTTRSKNLCFLPPVDELYGKNFLGYL
jgi:hypothetical protein